MRNEASVLHLDLDAFYASVEQRDKPSLRGKPVVVGGVGQRGVVATASYEARVFGVRSAMPAHEARRRCPNAAFLSTRFGAYREASRRVMGILRDLSPLVEPLSLDEAFVDLRAASRPVDFSAGGLDALAVEIKAAIAESTGGLTASVGIGTSKFIAKVASELNKPDGVCIVAPRSEAELLRPMSIGVIPGVGPVTADKLRRIGVATVADLQAASLDELVQVIGRAHGQGLMELAYARDDRPVEPEREAKSISVEDTFEHDLVDPEALAAIIDRHSRQVAERLRAARLFARTVTIKVRRHDFVTFTRSRTLLGATDRVDLILQLAQSMLGSVETRTGVRLLGVGVAGLTDVLQEELFVGDEGATEAEADGQDDADFELDAGAGTADHETAPTIESRPGHTHRDYPPGVDVRHDVHGDGWVWGSGLGRVTVRFETRETPPGPVRTFAADDPALRRIPAPD